MRAICGERHGRAKLRDDQVERIRELADTGRSYREIAVVFGVAVSQVCRIVNFKQRTDMNGVRCSLAAVGGG